MKWLTDSWYSAHHRYLRLGLLPLSFLYQIVVVLRRLLYQLGIVKPYRSPIPTIVVGNITVGGSGKTPVVIWLAKQLQSAGFQPGIVSRGYGGQAKIYPQSVTPLSDPALVGDEPVIISQQTRCPLVVDPRRVNAIQHLLEITSCDVIISDDGLQHYAMDRDIEIAVIDGMRGFGNRYCLPAGPLREPITRLTTVDYIITNGGEKAAHSYHMTLLPGEVINVADNSVKKPLSDFIKEECVHAIAGIGHPERFYRYLVEQGLQIQSHFFIDHHQFKAIDLHFDDNAPILMTEKDAIKCRHFATDNMWYIPVTAKIDDQLAQHLSSQLAEIISHG